MASPEITVFGTKMSHHVGLRTRGKQCPFSRTGTQMVVEPPQLGRWARRRFGQPPHAACTCLAEEYSFCDVLCEKLPNMLRHRCLVPNIEMTAN